MNPIIQLRQTTPLFLVAFIIACFFMPWSTQAVSPPPDGGYPNNNTAEGTAALFSLTTGADNTAVGLAALGLNLAGSDNTAIGTGALLNNTAGQNTAVGSVALFTNAGGTSNTATGFAALAINSGGSDNTAMGAQALLHNDTGSDNTAIGAFALLDNNADSNTAVGRAALAISTGSGNIALGNEAGSSLTTGDFNIDIANVGVAGESNTIRVGSSLLQSATFIAGIRGVTTGNMDAVPVMIDSVGQLGTVSSSERFKKDIGPMDKASEAILALKPVTFHYKKDTKGIAQFGLIAEDVAKVNPDLVVRDKDGEIYTVRYDAVNSMLLNEFLKEHKAFIAAEDKVEKLEGTVATLAATVKEQAAQIQKVSAQLEVNKPASQTVLNNQ